jgi:hypothetical protein
MGRRRQYIIRGLGIHVFAYLQFKLSLIAKPYSPSLSDRHFLLDSDRKFTRGGPRELCHIERRLPATVGKVMHYVVKLVTLEIDSETCGKGPWIH